MRHVCVAGTVSVSTVKGMNDLTSLSLLSSSAAKTNCARKSLVVVL